LRIAVVGSGAIGLYYGGKLAACGRDVRFLVRSGLRELQTAGLTLRGPDEHVVVPEPHCFRSTSDIGVCDLVLVAVKTTSSPDLVDLIPPLLGPDTLLLTLQNGLGNEEFLSAHFGKERVLGGLCFVCLRRVSPGMVERYDHGLINLGEYERKPMERTHRIGAQFRECGIECRVVADLILERWRKLVWNISFNALAILGGGIDTRQILGDEALRQATLALMEEVIGAANQCGIPLERSAADELIRRTETMGPYKPSTLLDFENGKSLEVEAIWGEPLRRAVAAGAQVPRLQLIYSTLHSLDQAQQRKRDTRP
jgi:2-dehydropantoate 2-reductase